MTPTARLAAALAWALDQLPDDPPRSADSGWCPADTAEWQRRRREARSALYEAQAAMSARSQKPTRKRRGRNRPAGPVRLDPETLREVVEEGLDFRRDVEGRARVRRG